MPPQLPNSLSPHVAVLTSSDLDKLLISTRQLPPLHQLLQSFTPLQQVTTRTTGLTPVTHSTFNLRFSALSDLETACRENPETRAERSLDWIGSRVAQQSNKWLEDPRMVEHERWWTELRACVEGERTPVQGEAWNHPVALILAVSTLASNPLQAITALHARPLEFPPWVEPYMLRHTLIVHPTPSNLNPDEAVALLNAVKKEFGLNTHLLQLPSSHEDKSSFDVSTPLPQLPLPGHSEHTSGQVSASHSRALIMSELDAQNTSRFVREFATMSLIPWMERCVAEWNEAFTSTRRISSRLFGSTARRFWGSSSSVTSMHSISHAPITNAALPPTSPTSPTSFSNSTLPAHRRLAEFATILGDYRLATAVWDAIRKDTSNTAGSGTGADVLPLILAPGPALGIHATAALNALNTPSARTQMRALMYAVRWEVGLGSFEKSVGGSVDGERWLALAAGGAEEPSSALLLARAASISVRKGAARRAALWYTMAARRLEKSGIKALTIHFFELANEARAYRPESLLSPSFFDIERKSSIGDETKSGFNGLRSFLEHALGRLKYSSGDTEGAIRLFSTLLRVPTSESTVPDAFSEGDKMYLEDFRDAFEHFVATRGEESAIKDLQLPITFSRPSQTRVHYDDLTQLSTALPDSPGLTSLQTYWEFFCRDRGEKSVTLDVSQSATAGESFYLEVTVLNPLGAEVTLTDVTVVVSTKDGTPLDPASVEVTAVEMVLLPARTSRTISFQVVSRIPGIFSFPTLSYKFIGLLPCIESLIPRGRRLNETPAQRQGITYAPGAATSIDVRHGGARLTARFVSSASPQEEDDDNGEIGVYDGEIRSEWLEVRNVGDCPVEEIWLILPPDGSVRTEDASKNTSLPNVKLHTLESPLPYQLRNVVLQPGENHTCTLLVHYSGQGPKPLFISVVFRKASGDKTFHLSQVHKTAWIQSTLSLNASAQHAPSSSDSSYSLSLSMENIGGPNDLAITQVHSMSSTWVIATKPSFLAPMGRLPYGQLSRTLLEVTTAAELDVDHVSKPMSDLATALAAVIAGRGLQAVPAPSNVSIHTSYAVPNGIALSDSQMYFIRASRRRNLRRMLASQFPSIPPTDYGRIFPLYTTLDFDIAVSWSIPSQSRSGLICFADLLTIGPRHAALNEALRLADEPGAQGRSIYAETQRERALLLDSIRACRWNDERKPVVCYPRSPPEILIHDFGNGPCVIPFTFVLRNESLSLASRFELRLHNPSPSLGTPNIKYIGHLTKRGRLPPNSSTTLIVKAVATSPGVFDLTGGINVEMGASDKAGHWVSHISYPLEDAGHTTVEVMASLQPQLI